MNIKRIYLIGLLLCFLFSLFAYDSAYASVAKWIKIGKTQYRIVDSADYGEGFGYGSWWYYYYHAYSRSRFLDSGWYLGVKDWKSPAGDAFSVKISSSGKFSSNEVTETIPVPDEEYITIRKYMRYQPPSIVVDGFELQDPMLDGDEVNPQKIPGTADCMIESSINTSMGMTVNQKVYGWSQDHHDDYVIFDFTFTNTGNVDLDEEIELPDQVLQDFYFMRIFRIYYQRYGTWWGCYGEYPSDSLRMAYAYPARRQSSSTDDIGTPRSDGSLRYPFFMGQTWIHCDKSVDDTSDDPAQPHMTANQAADQGWFCKDATSNSYSDWELTYQTMSLGTFPIDGTPYIEGAWPGTHHALRIDEQGYKYADETIPWYANSIVQFVAWGPFTLKPGDDVRIVWADVTGVISPEIGWKVGKEWKAGTCTWDGPSDLDKIYPVYAKYPDLIDNDNDYAKDRWIFTGRDSLFNNAWAANWNIKNNFNVPTPPPPPSIEVKSLPDRVRIIWGDESESEPDFAGYRVHRAIGEPYYSEAKGVVGKWAPIFECGEGTANALTHSYDDVTAERGKAYFYSVTAFDDGVGNGADVNRPQGGEQLESSYLLNPTTMGAYLTREPGKTLADVRVVPNPFNINAEELQYPGEPDKIMFMDVPGFCTIKIYTESGDLAKTIYHTDGSGDQSWGVLEIEYSTTNTGQIIVSGIYIAVIEENNEDGTPTGNRTAVKFVIVR